jgi:hypothetical protein
MGSQFSSWPAADASGSRGRLAWTQLRTRTDTVVAWRGRGGGLTRKLRPWPGADGPAAAPNARRGRSRARTDQRRRQRPGGDGRGSGVGGLARTAGGGRGLARSRRGGGGGVAHRLSGSSLLSVSETVRDVFVTVNQKKIRLRAKRERN